MTYPKTPGRVVLEYAEGFPTILGHTQLEDILLQRGEPSKIERVARRIRLEWPPIYPGLSEHLDYFTLADPWPDDRRELRRVRLEEH